MLQDLEGEMQWLTREQCALAVGKQGIYWPATPEHVTALNRAASAKGQDAAAGIPKPAETTAEDGAAAATRSWSRQMISDPISDFRRQGALDEGSG